METILISVLLNEVIELAKKIEESEEFGDREDLGVIGLISDGTVIPQDLDDFENLLAARAIGEDDHLGFAAYYLSKSIREIDKFHTTDIRDSYIRLATMHYKMSV